jgi:type II secretory pathway component PulC
MESAVRAFGRLLVVTLTIALAWRAGGWAWYFGAPRPNPVIPDLRGLVSIANVERFPWFGAVAPTAVTAPTSNIRLIGLFAGGKRPMALLVIGTQNPIAATAGETISPGLQLMTVAEDHVMLQRNGVSEKILLAAPTAGIPRETQSKEKQSK